MNTSTNNHPSNLNVICFGEVLWDNLPSGRKPGGAPMNVAYHLNKMGLNARPISKVGLDQNGEDLLEVMKSLQIDASFCEADQNHITSTVEVTFDLNGDAVYDIVFPVAWDFIEYQARYEAAVRSADAFVFGSLAGRNNVSRDTLFALLDVASYRVFDVNLRAPHYDKAYIKLLLGKSDLLKVNYQELEIIADWFGRSGDEASMVSILQDQTAIKEIIVTKGREGASYFSGREQYIQPAYQVEVKDTVGSGDSFLAAFLSDRLKGKAIKSSLNHAAKVAAYITTLDGACPVYEMEDVAVFQCI